MRQPSGYDPIGGNVGDLIPTMGGRRRALPADPNSLPGGDPGNPMPIGAQGPGGDMPTKPPMQLPPGIDIGQILGQQPQPGGMPMPPGLPPGMAPGGFGGQMNPSGMAAPGGAPSARDLIMRGLQGIFQRKAQG